MDKIDNMNKINSDCESKYLMITIHDNDFTSYFMELGITLYNIFVFEGTFPTEEDIPELKELIKYLWYSIHNIDMLMRWKNTLVEYKRMDEISYFYPDVKIINYLDIPEWEAGENIYIPLFTYGEILLR